MKALIVANGDIPGGIALVQEAVRSDIVVATDGAATRLPEGISPDFICGDFDSLDCEEACRRYPEARLISLPDQNCSDLEKTVRFVLKEGAAQLTLAGTFGGRMDHSLVALGLLMSYHRQHHIRAIDAQAELSLLSPECIRAGNIIRTCPAGATVSLIALSGEACVSITGVEWELDRSPLPPGSLGVSNRALGGTVTVTVHQGSVAVSFPLSTPENQ